MESFIGLFDSKKKYAALERVLNLPSFFGNLSQKSKLNSAIIFQLNSLVNNFENLINLYSLDAKKEDLLQELEVSKIYEKESTISTIKELIDDLEKNVQNNQKKLTYFEEDYLKRKNQIISIKKVISDYHSQIAKLNEEKKVCFGEINKITRSMERSVDNKPESDGLIDKNEDLSNSEKIKRLQINARDIKDQINQLKAKIEEKKSKITTLEPQFKVFESDHEKILSLIKKDKARIKELKEKLKNEIRESKTPIIIDNQPIEGLKVKSKKEIEAEITQIERELTQIEIPKEYYNPSNSHYFTKIQSKFFELANEVKTKRKEMQVLITEKEIREVVQSYESLETLINELEDYINLFLKKINLKSHCLITINKDKKSLFLEIIFTRNEKKQLKFENLTTPEKVFFVVIFYILIEMLNNSKCIIFSNLYIPNSYNKRGSIERAIKKILPLFSSEQHLLDINLLFIIANLDIKSDINNLKLIKVEES